MRRVKGDPNIEFEVICGARRHWTATWLRAHNYTDFRFLVEVRDLTDEEAFRVSDLENRTREDLSDIERARDYLRALSRHYGGHQGQMAERMKVTQSWLSRYLDLARLPPQLVAAFADPHDLKIKHVTQLKPLLKPEERSARVLAEATKIANGAGEGDALKPADVIRRLSASANPPKGSGSPKKSGSHHEMIVTASGAPVLRIEKRKAREVTLTLMLAGGGSRAEADVALSTLLNSVWPKAASGA